MPAKAVAQQKTSHAIDLRRPPHRPHHAASHTSNRICVGLYALHGLFS